MLLFNTFVPMLQKTLSQTSRTFVTCNQGMKSLLSNSLTSSVKPDNMWSFDTIRTAVRIHFPYPREVKRVKVNGFKKRMSTPGGRALLMRRILKGRHVLTH